MADEARFSRRCANCGVEFETTKRNYYYCSFACYQQHSFRERRCKVCGKIYTGPSWKKFCSGRCRAKSAIVSVFGDRHSFDLMLSDMSQSLKLVPAIPQLIAINVSASFLDQVSFSSCVDAVLKSNPSIYVDILREIPYGIESYMTFVNKLISRQVHDMPQVFGDAKSSLVIDARATLRFLITRYLGGFHSGFNPLETDEFKQGSSIIKELASVLPNEHYRRCPSCHLLGFEETQFRRIKIQNNWAIGELCIYCDQRSWYARSEL